MSIPLMVTKSYESQRITSWRQVSTQTNRDPNLDKILARSNQPRTSETYWRQGDVFGYELQFLMSINRVLPVFQNLNYKLQRKLSDVVYCPSNQVIKSDKISFLALGGLHGDKLCDTLQGMAPTNVKTADQTSLLHIESNLD